MKTFEVFQEKESSLHSSGNKSEFKCQGARIIFFWTYHFFQFEPLNSEVFLKEGLDDIEYWDIAL